MVTKISNVRIFDGETFTEPSDVYISDSKILDIQSANTSGRYEVSTAIDGSSKYLIPGLIDAHVHVQNQTSLLVAARRGITTALDMGCFPDPETALSPLRAASKGLTDLRASGIPATAPGSNHSKMPSMPAEALLTNVDEAKAFVQRRIDQKSDYIKIIADVPVGPSQEVLDALVAAAHEAGKLVVAHASRKGAFEMALQAGSDVLTHVPLDAPLSAETVAEMSRTGKVCCPTLIMMKSMSKIIPGANYSPSKESVRLLHEAGVPIIAGTDANDTKMCPVPLGVSLLDELGLLLEAGMSAVEVLRSVTDGSARVFNLLDRGRIEVGYRADLVLLGSNPLVDMKAMEDVAAVWCAGNQVNIN